MLSSFALTVFNNNPVAWDATEVTRSIFPGISTKICWLLPESPGYIFLRENVDKAIWVLTRLFGYESGDGRAVDVMVEMGGNLEIERIAVGKVKICRFRKDFF